VAICVGQHGGWWGYLVNQHREPDEERATTKSLEAQCERLALWLFQEKTKAIPSGTESLSLPNAFLCWFYQSLPEVRRQELVVKCWRL
jgi:hypothetical protein